ncbi:SAM-dependent methyltransferase [Mycobacterium sp.]|jgi:methyltransferase (TIGR00027 family)|uniref:SAM-dependent methyltransferase n=1 Tax=Mycobacterium sp. TaxID=1785 RepID=UPI002D2BB53B|nr:SAM-dependent methyltransferase [Mycobacterium sp.]HZA12186.1 SAM-dependent methyltransferase [Mycobacterium sp.]
MDNTKRAVASTGRLVAAMRAEETQRDDRLFTDPFAERLAGEEGRRLLAEAVAATGTPSAQIVVRTRFWDEALLRAQADGARQFVILAAGMDARAYRLPWHADTTVYEVDQANVIAVKDELLAGERPRCRRVTIGIDLANDWPKVLQSQGFTTTAKTVWLVEGLLQYLDASAVEILFARIDSLSTPGSGLLYDVVGETLRAAPFLRPTLQFMDQLGAPWLFATDTPAALIEPLGWTAVVTDAAEPGRRWNRWPHPAVPLDVPGVPRGYFVEATKT